MKDPEVDRPRRLADWLNPTGERKVHSLVDKVYKRKNLELAWERVKRNQGRRGRRRAKPRGVRGELDEHLDRLHEELQERYLPSSAGSRAADSQGGPAGEVAPAWHTDDL